MRKICVLVLLLSCGGSHPLPALQRAEINATARKVELSVESAHTAFEAGRGAAAALCGRFPATCADLQTSAAAVQTALDRADSALAAYRAGESTYNVLSGDVKAALRAVESFLHKVQASAWSTA